MNPWIRNDLTERQQLYLAALASGLTTIEIAKKYYVSHHTVRNTIAKAKERVGATSTANLVALAVYKEWIIATTKVPPYEFESC